MSPLDLFPFKNGAYSKKAPREHSGMKETVSALFDGEAAQDLVSRTKELGFKWHLISFGLNEKAICASMMHRTGPKTFHR